ncbi:MAG: NAD-dependent epimerase/dehydratase family protein [Bacteroidetes bacterium]|nr:NAD-dependent epimerase/dehydratase family protein [Bacteroidota bacterium]
MKTALILGAGGFIGSHLATFLNKRGYHIRGVDLKLPEFSKSAADEFVIGDLRDPLICQEVLDQHFDEVYQLAADMGGAEYIFTGENDADVMHNSSLINVNIAHQSTKRKVGRIFYSSSACIYPLYNQMDPDNPKCAEDSAYPAAPDSDYGWEKLFSEHLYQAFHRNYDLDVRIARFHNVFGPEGTYTGGREKAPAALCRKVATTPDGGSIEVWGDGLQTRSFLYIDECLTGIRKLMDSDFPGPVNIGSEEMISINNLAHMIIGFSGRNIRVKNIEGPIGVRGRNSDNALIRQKLNWAPSQPLRTGIEITYRWIESMVK